MLLMMEMNNGENDMPSVKRFKACFNSLILDESNFNMCQGGSPWIWRSLLNPSCRFYKFNGIIYIFRAFGSVAERTNREIALIM